MWHFTLKQDRLTVARGFSEDKETVLSEAGRYFSQYSDEDFGKMTLTVWEDVDDAGKTIEQGHTWTTNTDTFTLIKE